jgi:hypothetical protein
VGVGTSADGVNCAEVAHNASSYSISVTAKEFNESPQMSIFKNCLATLQSTKNRIIFLISMKLDGDKSLIREGEFRPS